jgi:hypothetical protein
MGEEESLAESLDVLSPDGIRSGRSKLRYLCSILFWRHFFDCITLLCFLPYALRNCMRADERVFDENRL